MTVLVVDGVVDVGLLLVLVLCDVECVELECDVVDGVECVDVVECVEECVVVDGGGGGVDVVW